MKWKTRINPFARPEAPPEIGPSRVNDLDLRREPSGTPGERGVDLVFVIDTTGSMSDKIESLLATCSRTLQVRHCVLW
jgi:Mg-chelatase subunit ChlD